MTTPTQQQQALAKSSNGRGGGSAPAPESENIVAEVLENTLWNRQLGVMSEEIVAALVCQIFEGAHTCLPMVALHCSSSSLLLQAGRTHAVCCFALDQELGISLPRFAAWSGPQALARG